VSPSPGVVTVAGDVVLTGSTTLNATPNGIFDGLAEGAVLTQDGFQFQITYQGGTDGDSVVLTRLT
jgi:hypothetical protein